jgi:L-ascorbate metabolism protein UlaG (beta-lactamase superfamily)
MGRFYGTKVTWLGHSTFKIESPKGQVILIDPWLDNPRAPKDAKKHTKKVDYILITHGHGDHLGSAIEVAKKTKATVVAIHEISVYLTKKGLKKVIGMNKGGTVDLNGIKVTMVDATHSSGIEDRGKLIPGGEAAGYIITMENGFRIYHMGDTGFHGTLNIIGDFYGPDLVLIPIGGTYTMGPEEAAYAVRILRPNWIIPMHYGTFPVLTGTPQKFIKSLTSTYKGSVIELRPGETAE